jgi:hypothetical protein
VIPKEPSTWEYDFEKGSQGWTSTGLPIASVAPSSTQHFNGSKSLSVNFAAGETGTASAYVENPTVPAGATVTFHVWVPSGTNLAWIKPFATGLNGQLAGPQIPMGSVQTNAWNTLHLTVPSVAWKTALLGVQFGSSAPWSGTCFIDAVGW